MPQYDKAMAQHENKIRQYDKFRRLFEFIKVSMTRICRHRAQKRALANFVRLKHNAIFFHK